MTTTVPKGKRLTGPDLEKLTKEVTKLYNKKMSIREIAEMTGRSYGAVHRMLAESGTALRSRGGATRGKAVAKK